MAPIATTSECQEAYNRNVVHTLQRVAAVGAVGARKPEGFFFRQPENADIRKASKHHSEQSRNKVNHDEFTMKSGRQTSGDRFSVR